MSVWAWATGANSDARQCPTCRGTGINPVAIYLLCPKCNGERYVRIDGTRIVNPRAAVGKDE